ASGNGGSALSSAGGVAPSADTALKAVHPETSTWAPAQMTSPTDGSTISSTTTFTWSAGTGNTQYWLSIGTTAGGTNILNANEGTATQTTVDSLPAGSIYVRLWSGSAGYWKYNDYSYTTGTWTLAAMTTPPTGSTIAPTMTFTWSP